MYVYMFGYVHIHACLCVCETEREKRERSDIYRRNLERKGFSGAQTVKNLPAMKETWV